jgi:hypothetical protein
MNLDIEKIKVTQNSLSYQKCCVNSDLQSLFEPLVLDDDSLLQDKIFESLLFNGSMKDLLHYIGSIYTTPEDSRLF